MTPSPIATVVAELTPPGRAAVAVVVVTGPQSLQAVSKCFVARSGRPVSEIPIGQIVLGRWGGVAAATEELVLCRRGEDHIEIHCHGGAAAVNAVVNRLINEGCQRLSWQAWVNRCSPDRIQAAARIALADAVTERTAAILLDQWNGALTAAVNGLLAEISAAELPAAAEKIDELLSRREMGLHLTSPWRVVVFGAPNVGKSSLINALAGYERAIVSETPGTTRDVVTLTTAIEGWPVQLSDTAGFRETQDELESAGIELATTSLAHAELAIFVHDAARLSDDLSDYVVQIVRPLLAPHIRTIQVVNKIDLISAAKRCELLDRFKDSRSAPGNLHAVSALNGEGVADLLSSISRALVPESFQPGTAVPFTIEQFDRLADAKSAIDRCDAAEAIKLLQALLTRQK
jgi:tRNA modification GTPase